MQLWYLNRQRHCLSQSQRLRYIVSGKSHSKQCRGQETPLLQPRCTLKWSPGCPPLDDAFGYNHLRGHLRLSHFFFFFHELRFTSPRCFHPLIAIVLRRRGHCGFVQKENTLKGISMNSATACPPTWAVTSSFSSFVCSDPLTLLPACQSYNYASD